MANYDMTNNLEGVVDDYFVYKNAAGFMEGFKKNKNGKDVKRLVTNQTTLSGFEKYLKGLKKQVPLKDRPIKTSKLPNLPFPEE